MSSSSSSTSAAEGVLLILRDGRLLGYLLLVPGRRFIVPAIIVLWPC